MTFAFVRCVYTLLRTYKEECHTLLQKLVLGRVNNTGTFAVGYTGLHCDKWFSSYKNITVLINKENSFTFLS